MHPPSAAVRRAALQGTQGSAGRMGSGAASAPTRIRLRLRLWLAPWLECSLASGATVSRAPPRPIAAPTRAAPAGPPA